MEPHPPLTQLDPSIPAAFEAIAGKALAKKPEDRYQRGGEMASDLRKIRGLERPGMVPAATGAGADIPLGSWQPVLQPCVSTNTG